MFADRTVGTGPRVYAAPLGGGAARGSNYGYCGRLLPNRVGLELIVSGLLIVCSRAATLMVDAQCFALFGDFIVQRNSCGKQGVVPCRTRVVRQ
jgi:hypothetical protein